VLQQQQQQQQQQQLTRHQGRRVNMDGFSKLTQQVASSSDLLSLICSSLSFEICECYLHSVIDASIGFALLYLHRHPHSRHHQCFSSVIASSSCLRRSRSPLLQRSLCPAGEFWCSLGVHLKPKTPFKTCCSSITVLCQQPLFGSCPPSLCQC
jgi:hypothetical protein